MSKFTDFSLLGAIENHVEYLLDAKVLEFVRSKHYKGKKLHKAEKLTLFSSNGRSFHRQTSKIGQYTIVQANAFSFQRFYAGRKVNG